MRKTCLEEIYNLAKKDKRVVFVGSDLGAGTLEKYRQEMPERFFMEGVSEQHLIGMCAGMAKEGFIPYFNTIATFLTRRAFEQIAVDVGMHNLPVRLIGSGGGLVYAPLGPTHTAVDDIALMRTIPNMTVVAPADAEEMKRIMKRTLDYKGPMYIRLAKGGDPIVTPDKDYPIGKAVIIQEGKDVLVCTTGITLGIALEGVLKLMKKKFSCAILHFPTVKPIDKAAIIHYASFISTVITIEEGRVSGGLGSAIAEIISEVRWKQPKVIRRIGIPDEFPEKYGRQEDLLRYYDITAVRIVKEMKKGLKEI